jgi:hypothetical protein
MVLDDPFFIALRAVNVAMPGGDTDELVPVAVMTALAITRRDDGDVAGWHSCLKDGLERWIPEGEPH